MKKIVIGFTTASALITYVAAAASFESAEYSRADAPMLIFLMILSAAWLGLVGYANRKNPPE